MFSYDFISFFSNQISFVLNETLLTQAIEKNDIEIVQKILSINGIDPTIPKVLIQNV